MERVDVVYSFAEENGDILMVKNKKNQSWTLPGGKVEAGESLTEAAAREMKEETGYGIQPLDILAVNEAVISSEHVYFIVFRARITDRPDAITFDENIVEPVCIPSEWNHALAEPRRGGVSSRREKIIEKNKKIYCHFCSFYDNINLVVAKTTRRAISSVGRARPNTLRRIRFSVHIERHPEKAS